MTATQIERVARLRGRIRAVDLDDPDAADTLRDIAVDLEALRAEAEWRAQASIERDSIQQERTLLMSLICHHQHSAALLLRSLAADLC